jgi:hypothetical protein
MLGYHLCFGTLGGWPMHRPKSLSSCIALARVMLEASRRPVDYFHMPVLDGAHDSYFAPLKNFQAPDTKIYLGVIHHMDDPAEFTRLVLAASRSVADFGIAAPCGFGREPRPAAGLLKEHVDAMAALRALRT